MNVRFQADADLNHVIVKATLRREPNIDFQTAHAAGRVGLRDPEVLAQSADAGSVLITHDRKTISQGVCRLSIGCAQPVRGCAA